MKAALDLPVNYARALQTLLKLLPPREVRWALTGSAGLRLQGVDLSVHDLDIQCEGHNIYLIEGRLAECMKTPVHRWETARMRSLDGKAEVGGVEIELLADIVHLQGDGSWVTFTDLSQLIWVDWPGGRVPVFPLEQEAAAYDAMGRHQKAGLIRRRIQNLKENDRE